MDSGSEGAGGILKIVGGVAVFVVCWIIQATLGDSSMFSMSYVDNGFLAGLVVNVTFWPGWIATGWLIGTGVMDLLGEDEAPDANPSA